MNQYIKTLWKRFLKNLKHHWILGVICLAASIVFVVISSFTSEVMEIESDIFEGKKLVGVHSMHQLEWGFESKEYADGNGVIFQTEIANAKEGLQFLVTMSTSGNFWNTVNQELVKQEFEGIDERDYFTIKGTSYNILEIKVFGYDDKRVEAMEQIIRTQLESIAKGFYDVVSMSVISEPVMLEASIVNNQYELSHKIYQENETSDNIENPVESGKMFSFTNIIIVLSSLVLWAVIVLLLTLGEDEGCTGVSQNGKESK